MELREYLQILRRRRWIVAGTLIAVLLAALAVTLRMQPIYEASARVEVQPAPSSSSEAAQLVESMVDPARRLATQVELIKGEGVLSRAIRALKLPSVDDLRENLSVKLLPDTQIVQISVRHSRPQEARDWANAVASAYLDDRRDRAVERTSLATGPLDRNIQDVQQRISDHDATLSGINDAIVKAQASKDTLTAELASVEQSLDQPPAPQAPAIDSTLPGRIDAINKRMSELDTAIYKKQQEGHGDQIGAELAEKDRLRSELAPLQQALLTPRPVVAPTQSAALIKHASDLRGQISVLDAQIRNVESQLTGPKNERDTLVAQLTALQVQRQGLPDPDVLRQSGGAVITAAEMPTIPASPKLGLNLVMALVLGTMLGVGFAFLAENLDDRVRSTEEVEERVGAPVLGHVPYVVEWGDSPEPLLATVHRPTSGAAEAYRTLKTNLRFLSLERPLGTVLVTSTLAGEGKSTTAANLAVALAEGGTRTILVSADLRRPSIHKFFEVADSGGIMSVLEGTMTVEGALKQTQVPNLRLLPAGGRPPNPTEILASSRFAELLESLASISDLVLIDAPPALGLADASALASKVDGVLFLVDAHEVARRSLSHAAEQIRKAGGRILGTIMNGVVADEAGYGYYYQYYYSYSDDPARSDRGRGRDGERGRRGRRGADDEPLPEEALEARSGETRTVDSRKGNGRANGQAAGPQVVDLDGELGASSHESVPDR